MNRLISDICLAVCHSEGNLVLQTHPQAEFSYSVSNPALQVFRRYPDCAAFVFNMETKELKPAFWIEGKPLSDGNPKPRRWRADIEFWRIQAGTEFGLAIRQLREQVQFAFKAFGLEQFVSLILATSKDLLSFPDAKSSSKWGYFGLS